MTQHSSQPGLPSLGAVIVTFHPDLEVLERLIDALKGIGELVVVDNGSSAQVADQVEVWLLALPSARVIRNPLNLGLAAALNQGLFALAASAKGIDRALLLDQDTRFQREQVHGLAEAFRNLTDGGESVAAVGPALIDGETGTEYGFHCIRGLLWRRLRNQTRPVSCASLNGSGTLLSLDAWKQTGPMDETFFIDHIDTEWSFRALALGRRLYGIPSVRVPHRMGQHPMRFWLLGSHETPYRPPLRHYYLFRNTLILMRRPYTPWVWRFWAVIKLVWTVLLFELRDVARHEQWRLMKRGIADGWAGRGGEIPEFPR